MRRIFFSFLTGILLLSGFACAEDLTTEENSRYLAVGNEILMRESGYSEEEMSRLLISEPYTIRYPSKGVRIDILYLDQYYVNDSEPWELDVFSCSLDLFVDSSEAMRYECEDLYDFLGSINKAMNRNLDLQELERMEREKGRFRDWSEQEQFSFLSEHGAYYSINTNHWDSVYPEPQIPQVWEVVEIGETALIEEFNIQKKDLEWFRKRISYMNEADGSYSVSLYYSPPIELSLVFPSYSIMLDLKSFDIIDMSYSE